MRYAVLRTHGGLGNQLFQLLYGRLFAETFKCELREVHDLRYEHRFPRGRVPPAATPPSFIQSMVSAARIPKVMQRSFGRAEAPLLVVRTWFLDGYFQSADQYRAFADNNISAQLDRLKCELAIGPASDDACLVHLRVGDFFGDRDAARRHVIERLRSIPIGAHIMSNDETIFEDSEIIEIIERQSALRVATKGICAENVLRTMARYRRIDGNDSTLTVWAHVLAGARVNFRDQRLAELANFLYARGADTQAVA